MTGTTAQRVTIIGTSNSIMMNGWTRFLKEQVDDADVSIENLSVGGSSSRYGAFMLSGDNCPAASERIVLDFCINDQMFLDSGTVGMNDVRSHYATMISEAWQRGVLDKILVLMFPQSKHFVRSADDVLFAELLAIFDFFGVDYIDCRGEIDRWANERGCDTGGAFIDPRHYTPDFQQRIAEVVLARLAASSPRRRTRKVIEVLDGIPRVGYREIEIIGDVERAVVGTSVLQRSVFEFDRGDSVYLRGSGFLAALFVWVHENSGALTFRSPDGDRRFCVRRNLQNYFLFDTMSPVMAMNEEQRVDVINDHTAPYQPVLSLHSPNFDDAGSTTQVVAFVGCDLDPGVAAAYLDRLRSRTTRSRTRSALRRADRKLHRLVRRLLFRTAGTGSSV